jgi:hypothetical protein
MVSPCKAFESRDQLKQPALHLMMCEGSSHDRGGDARDERNPAQGDLVCTTVYQRGAGEGGLPDRRVIDGAA